MFTVSEKKTPHGLLLVITDSEIVGKRFEQGKLQLDLTTQFYKGQEKNVEEIEEIVSRARYIHFTGDKSVQLGLNLKLIDQKKILHIAGIPHAEVVQEE